MRVYTKTGDQGKTSLVGGEKTYKYDDRVWAYGTIDELNSNLGFARAILKDKEAKEVILKIQKELFEVGEELASLGNKNYKENIKESHVKYVEDTIDYFDKKKCEINNFIIPGGTKESAALDMARTTTRKAERYIVKLTDEYDVNKNLLKYINRLSDLFYILARVEDYKDILEKSKKKIDIILKNKKMSRKLARYIVDNCIEKAEEMKIPVAVCIVDEGGNIVSLERMDEALIVSIEVSKNKAYTSLAFNMKTEDLTSLAKPEGKFYGINSLDNVTTFAGGVPLKIDHKIIGAIGVSGGSVKQDKMIAEYGFNIFRGGMEYGIRK